jgi:hypothetical protein
MQRFKLIHHIGNRMCSVIIDVGLVLVIGFIGYFQLLITIRYAAIANLHNLQLTGAANEFSRIAISSSFLW